MNMMAARAALCVVMIPVTAPHVPVSRLLPSQLYAPLAITTMDSLQGQLLIASTGLLDPNFARTVVLVAAHGEEGALGLILNREMNVPLQQVWGQVSESPCLRSGNVRHGGPVGGTLMALHDLQIHANVVVTENVFAATELGAMESLASSDEGLALFYIGHSGWGPGQLENELAEGSWLLLPADSAHVFGEQDTSALWKEAMTEVGRWVGSRIEPDCCQWPAGSARRASFSPRHGDLERRTPPVRKPSVVPGLSRSSRPA